MSARRARREPRPQAVEVDSGTYVHLELLDFPGETNGERPVFAAIMTSADGRARIEVTYEPDPHDYDEDADNEETFTLEEWEREAPPLLRAALLRHTEALRGRNV